MTSDAPTAAAEPAETGGVTKTGAKNAKADAQKYYKKKSDPEGLKRIEEGDVAFKAGDFEKAKQLFDQATEICKSSTVESNKKPKEPQPADGKEAPKKSADGPLSGTKLLLSNPKDNIQAKPMREGVPEIYNYAKNTEEMIKKHLAETGGKYITRFPPEPNGYLHIGHAKAMNFNFGQARIAQEQGFGGETIMRFDDTNPEAEKQEYIDSILANVAFLGNKPVRVTYSSDYFQELYDFAVELIKSGNAYVCHQTKEQVKASRDVLRQAHIDHLEAIPPAAMSPWRDTSVEENLLKFDKMRTGQYEEGEAFLRMKGVLTSDNPAMWDTVFYRIKYSEHPHSGSKWCIYPTYDYTHCIVDSLENITHSLCTLEFESRQAADGPYYWLLHHLKVYKPVTWEYSRLNITYNVLSKRRLNTLVTEGFVNRLNTLVIKGFVDGWDDPRLLTLDGLRRRGYTPSAINAFCEQIGVTRSGTITTQMHVLENCIRRELDANAPRAFALLAPLRVNITSGVDADVTLSVPNHPTDATKGQRDIVFSKVIYINSDDFREVDEPGYYGLAPGKEVGLLGTGVILTCTSVVKDPSGKVKEIQGTVRPRGEDKPKGTLQWLSDGHYSKAEVRLYSYLFTCENPNSPPGAKPAAAAAAAAAAVAAPVAAPEGDEEEGDEAEGGSGGGGSWLDWLNKESLIVEAGAMVEPHVAAAAPGTHFQFQRIGYFVADHDSRPDRPVFNRVVALKEGDKPVVPPSKPAKP